MKALAGFIMRGPGQAALVTGVTGLLSVPLPLFGLLSTAALALVTLRNGARAGALVGVLGGLGATLLAVLLFGSPWALAMVMAVLWLPVWGLAAILRFSRSLALAAQLAGLVGILLILLVHGVGTEPAVYWEQILEPLRGALIKDGVIEAATAQALFADLAPWMTGAFAAALILQLLLGLFIGRWWQAELYNPGGFGADFRAFRLHPGFGLLGLVLVVTIGFLPGPGVVSDLLLTLMPLLLLQGLAVVHDLLRARGAKPAWLAAFYVLLVLFMPRTLVLVACLGLVDIWADLRARLARRPNSPT